MEPKALFDTPFTHINEQGIAGVFNQNDSKKVIDLIRHINKNANPNGKVREIKPQQMGG